MINQKLRNEIVSLHSKKYRALKNRYDAKIHHSGFNMLGNITGLTFF